MALWTSGWRDRVWSSLDQTWDLIIVGGGITGAGILREASRAGWRALLVEARDFASGTSSRSSKLVHGGLRYLSHFQIKLTAESVRERERLLLAGPGLIAPLENILANYDGDKPPSWVMGAGLVIYDLLALKWRHQHHSTADVKKLCPSINTDRLLGGYTYLDAQTDDARLVLRVMAEAAANGGTPLNYASVEGLLRLANGQVTGIRLRDQASGKEKEVHSPVVINATGAWADRLRSHIQRKPRLRPLRGSHLFFPREVLPLTRSISFLHPRDHRPVFAYPWEGVILVGTTDVDQGSEMPADPRLSAAEAEYLLEAVDHAFKPVGLRLEQAQSSIAGIRAVVNTGQSDPSRESREFVLWDEDGLLTVTGGKLTTFRLMAQQALHAVRHRLPQPAKEMGPGAALDSAGALLDAPLDPATRLRLLGRYGSEAGGLVRAALPDELTAIAGTPYLWAELRWAARAEAVVHLEDLLLRRVRLGLLAPQGGMPLIDRIRTMVQPELGWDDARWQSELTAYLHLWRQSYSATL